MPRFRDRVAKGECLHCRMMDLIRDWQAAQEGEFSIDGEQPCSAGDRIFNDTLCVLADIVAAQATRDQRRMLLRMAADQLPGLVTEHLRLRQARAERKIGGDVVGHA